MTVDDLTWKIGHKTVDLWFIGPADGHWFKRNNVEDICLARYPRNFYTFLYFFFLYSKWLGQDRKGGNLLPPREADLTTSPKIFDRCVQVRAPAMSGAWILLKGKQNQDFFSLVCLESQQLSALAGRPTWNKWGRGTSGIWTSWVAPHSSNRASKTAGRILDFFANYLTSWSRSLKEGSHLFEKLRPDDLSSTFFFFFSPSRQNCFLFFLYQEDTMKRPDERLCGLFY